MRYVIHVAEEKGGPFETYGPYEDYPTAHAAGMVYARQGKDVSLYPADEAAICDFCSSPLVAWSYDVEDFRVGSTEWGSRGGWAACDDCHDLIEKGDPRALALHSLRTFFTTNSQIPDQPEVRSHVYEHIRTVHGEFWAHKRSVRHI